MLETPRRREIEDAASTLFRERGYRATSVRDIATALAIRGPSLYAHVTSKEDVLWAIVDRAATRFEQAADTAAASAPADAARRLAALVHAHVAVIAADPGQASVFVAEWRHLSTDRRTAILARRDAYEERFRIVIRDGMADGTFAMTDPALAATFLLSALNGVATWYRPEGRLAPDRIADHFADLSVRSLMEAHR
ncbi:MAG TPA: TetR/AcrR family transcriptional regulator [Candidatus Limnocylindrales bacterium]|jgi:AcrR family transcriptional regulator